jgi:hypothetical protein
LSYFVFNSFHGDYGGRRELKENAGIKKEFFPLLAKLILPRLP